MARRPMCAKPSCTDIQPAFMVIPTYDQLQKAKNDKVKARFYDLMAPSAVWRTVKCTQTPLDSFVNGNDIELRAELVSKDKTICALKEQIAHNHKLNSRLNRQLMKSSFAHSDKDDDILTMKSELAAAQEELKKKDMYLVDFYGSKEREAQMVDKLAKQHMIILRLIHFSNLGRKRVFDMCGYPTEPETSTFNAKAKCSECKPDD